MAWLVIKNRHQTDMGYDEIGLCTLYIDNSTFNRESTHMLKGGGGALNVACKDPCGCIKVVLIVLRGYKIYIRYGYSLF